jgi:quercetin dioxygenase-like cupin family protein
MDAKGFLLPPGAGRICDIAPGRSVDLMIQNHQSAESVMMFEELAPPDTATDWHLHHDSDEIAYVLSGEVTFKIGEATSVGAAGACAFMPRGLAHAWKTTGTEPARILFLYTPGAAGKVFEEAAELRPDLQTAEGRETFTTLVKRHAWAILGPPPF